MFSIESWQEIFETIRKNKLRTFLTAFSVFLGIFILVILMGFSNGIENGVTTQFESDATNKISIRTGTTTKGYQGLNPGRRLQLRNGDYDNLNQKYENNIEYKTATYSTWGGQVNYKTQQGNYRIEGANADQQFIENQDMVSGRFLNQADLDENNKVAIIGQQMKMDLFKDEDPIGKMIMLNNNVNFQVVGVYTDPGGSREESRLFIPLTTAQQVFNAGQDIRSIAYTVKMEENFDQAVATSAAMSESIEQELRSRFTVNPEDRSAIYVSNTLEEAEKIYGLIDTIRMVFWFIGIGTIIAGIVGVSNIMLIIVKERTKEIGIRKALGALPSQITGMILQEAIFITALSGLVGLLAGVFVLEALSPLVETDFLRYPKADLGTSLTTLAILIIAGALAGYIPARRASNIKPIEALRDE
ncbi:ABC transporter permease [Nonlabens marinus]|uniref:ABC transporter permease protein n=1 Tax=Nonlabens marinus S1-08 TaxID=1454201 RepID=W8VPT3_9FLAO|nr:ABC transporter permease [Nonlabens marinus]BAO54665.1 ABC transporter permease protein [Nonlabens marinus S1-08]